MIAKVRPGVSLPEESSTEAPAGSRGGAGIAQPMTSEGMTAFSIFWCTFWVLLKSSAGATVCTVPTPDGSLTTWWATHHQRSQILCQPLST